MNKKLQVAKYIVFDFLSALIAWGLFFIFRKITVDAQFKTHLSEIFHDPNFFLGIIFIPLFWMFLYILMGTYRKIYRRSRLKELGQTILITFLGSIVIFFALILDDIIVSYKSYYILFMVLVGLHFLLTYIPRLIITTITNNKIHNRKLGFNTLIIGCNGHAFAIYNELENQPQSTGNKFVGFVDAGLCKHNLLEAYLPHLGAFKDLKKIITDNKIEEVIIAIERSEKDAIERIFAEIEDSDVVIKISPIMQDILMGVVKTSSIFSPLIEIAPDIMPAWQQSLKRLMDIVISVIAMVILIPVYLGTAIGVLTSSRGPVFYTQVRMGLHGKPFRMIKFRSMFQDAEKDTPMLSSKDDPRITRFGKIMRQYRLDEIPQFFSVLKGDMSLVGPRPERQFFSEQIISRMPHFRLLMKVKPGITSWGQVKFGYAENVDQMIERARFDLIYLENMSIAMDVKILIYTVLIVIQGRGK